MRLSQGIFWIFISTYLRVLSVLGFFSHSSGANLQATNSRLSRHFTPSTKCLPSSPPKVRILNASTILLQQLLFRKTHSSSLTITVLAAPTCLQIHSPSAYPAKTASASQLSSYRRNKTVRFALLPCNHKACLVLRMEEKQRSLLNTALVKLDQFCRALLSGEQSPHEKVDEGILQGDIWTHTIFPLAFEALQRSLRAHTPADNAASCKSRAPDPLGKFKGCGEEKGGGGCSGFEFFCNSVSVVLGIPCGPNRKHGAGEEGGTRRCESALAEAALRLPNAEEVELIAKMVGRVPYGLLSVACTRKRQTREKLAESEQQVPQVLTVSPFWIAQKSKIEPSSTGCGSSSVRQRIVDSVVKLSSLDTTQAEAQLTPFPTTFWLCDPKLTAKLSQAELTGWTKEVENGLLAHGTAIQEEIIYDNIRFIALRWLLMPKAFLSHFYSANRRCERCKTLKPEGHMFPEYAKAEHSTCASSEAQEEEERSPNEVSMGSKENRCAECLECCCKLCKLLQCHRQRGIGGLMHFCRVRCLHMQYAHHLACPTTLGNLIDDAFGMHSYST